MEPIIAPDALDSLGFDTRAVRAGQARTARTVTAGTSRFLLWKQNCTPHRATLSPGVRCKVGCGFFFQLVCQALCRNRDGGTCAANEGRNGEGDARCDK